MCAFAESCATPYLTAPVEASLAFSMSPSTFIMWLEDLRTIFALQS